MQINILFSNLKVQNYLIIQNSKILEYRPANYPSCWNNSFPIKKTTEIWTNENRGWFQSIGRTIRGNTTEERKLDFNKNTRDENVRLHAVFLSFKRLHLFL